MRAAVGLTDGLGLDGDRRIRVIPRQMIPEMKMMVKGKKLKVILVHQKTLVKLVMSKSVQ